MLSPGMTHKQFSITRPFSLGTLLLLGFFPMMPTAVAQGVCDRTLPVRITIIDAIAEVDNCEDVTDEHLGTISYLNLSGKELTSLEPLDFGGLSGLVDINLERNTLRILPMGLFDNLKNIEIIRLGHNQLSELPNKAFSELPSLRILKLNDNQLHTLSARSFKALPALYELDIGGNSIAELSDAIFISTPRLNSLKLDFDSVEYISPSVFGEVSFLRLDTPQSLLVVPDAFFTQQSGFGAGMAVFSRRSSRLFAVKEQYPPSDFAAYGILAFPSGVTSHTLNRYMAICEAFVATLLASSELVEQSIPESAQFPTIWPLYSSQLANALNSNLKVNITKCDQIVRDIDAAMSAIAIDRAERQGTKRVGNDDLSLGGDGPYLLAWAPGADFENADDDVLVLHFDLSNVMNSEQANRVFRFWTEEIERDPGTWERGFDVGRMRLKVMLGVDKYGGMILDVFSSILGD